MVRIVFGIFMILHGLVHLLYFGQSARFFELQPGLTWPDGAWAFSQLLGNENTRMLANVLLIIAALIFVAAGIATLARMEWWKPMATTAAIFSSVLYILFWDGGMQNLSEKGAVGILLNLVLLAVIYVFRWLT